MEIKVKIGLNPCGAYDGTREYSFLDTTESSSGTYMSLKDNNKGHEVTDTTWWECIIDLTGVNKAKDDANTAASNADNKAALANTAIENANTATQTANTAASNADAATSKANTAATSANNATASANTATQTANTAASNADAATSKANTAATSANNATASANTAITMSITRLPNSLRKEQTPFGYSWFASMVTLILQHTSGMVHNQTSN